MFKAGGGDLNIPSSCFCFEDELISSYTSKFFCNFAAEKVSFRKWVQ